MDVPDPNDQEVMQFAATATLEGSSDDVNAATWGTADETNRATRSKGIGPVAGKAAQTPR